MYRLKRTLVGGLLILTAMVGCRNARREVPPGPDPIHDGRTTAPDVGFSTKPRDAPPSAFGGPVGGASGNLAGAGSVGGTPQLTNPYDTPPAGNAGLGRPPALGESTLDPLKPVRGRMGSPDAAPSPY